MSTQWTIKDIWNLSFDTKPETLKPRDYLYASEIGGSYIEVWLKMKGIPVSNPPTISARGKMEAGVIYESVLRFVLKRAGLLISCQEKVNYEIPGLLSVHGKLDFCAGGDVDLNQSLHFADLTKKWFEELGWPDRIIKISAGVVEMIKTLMENGGPLAVYVYEAKSVADFVFRLIENQNKPRDKHRLQTFHYLLGKKMQVAKIAYLNREDARINELEVYNNSQNYKDYVTWIKTMTDYWNSDTMPPLEPLVVWEPKSCKFNKNTMGVEWSSYLTQLYGFWTPQEYRDYIKPIFSDMNYVYERCVKGDKLTDKNKKSIEAAKKWFPNWDDLVDQGKLMKVLKEEVKEQE